jgi:phenylpyruvate tautomerase PptA (4-oxalocrotonate tautomerase family)
MTQKNKDQSPADSFKDEFLAHYLSFGIGALGKKDIDVLVMHLLDKYGIGGGPLRNFPNQSVSGLLKAPAAKIKLLRYEAGLKYGGRVEDQAKAKLLTALSRAVIEVETKKICLIVEDALAKNWLQGELKNNGLIFDHSFNTEIVKVDSKGLFSVLGQFFDAQETEKFKTGFERLEKEKKDDQLRQGFAKLAKDFAVESAKKAGGAILTGFGIPIG